MRCCRALYLVGVSLLPTLGAEELSATLDPAKTKISFTLKDVLHVVRGTFQLKEGHVSFDPATGACNGTVVVEAASGNSGSTVRDKRMTRSVLEADRYPEIRFTPRQLAGSISFSAASTVEVSGSFSIHGQAHKITIPMQIRALQNEISAEGKFVVPYVQWGMKNPSNFLLKVNDTVEIEVIAVGLITGMPHNRN
jgi:polyisoprenoid-binding protein YceI